MARNKSLIAVAIIAALGLLVLRFWSQPGSRDEGLDVEVEPGARLTRPSGGRDRSQPRDRRDRAGVAGLAGWSGSGVRSGETDARASGTRSLGPRKVGSDASGTSAHPANQPSNRSPSTNLAAADAAKGPAARAASRAALVDLLASQPKVQVSEEVAAGGPPAADGDVVLSAGSPKDTAEPVVSQSVKASHDGTGVVVEDGAQVAYPADLINSAAGSITFDIGPDQWIGGDENTKTFVELRNPDQSDDRVRIFRDGHYLRFVFSDESNAVSGISYPIDEWQPGDHRRITATWGDGKIHLFVNGQPVGEGTPETADNESATNPHPGSDDKGSDATAAGTIKNFRLYNRALSADEIVGR